MTHQEILAISARRTFVASRYRWRDDALRRLVNRLAKAGFLAFGGVQHKDLTYQATPKGVAWLASGEPFRWDWNAAEAAHGG